jgi:deoxycytidylate deaminase
MKTEHYLNLCLEQAAMSPLRYRHGSVIVRGGKVIGEGYNDYRSGFDGGTLKTGVMPLRSLDRPAIAELKRKHKLKPGQKREPATESAQTFKPFEGTTGGGKLANAPLSMHSEMMAIQSALAAAVSLASGAVSSQKTCCKYCSYGKVLPMMC